MKSELNQPRGGSMNGPFLFMVVGFIFFVGSVVFYLYTDNSRYDEEFRNFRAKNAEVDSVKKDLEAVKERAQWLVDDRQKLFNEKEALKEEVEKLHDSYASTIARDRELGLRQDALEKYSTRSQLPTTIEVVFVDNPKRTVSKSPTTDKRGNNETPKSSQKPTKGNAEAPKANRSEAPAKRKNGLGRSYRDVESGNSGRVPPSRKGH